MRLTTNNGRLTVPVQLPPMWAAALVIGVLLLVFELDRATGDAPVQHLYYVPIILAGLRFRTRGGAIAAAAAIVLYHVANPHLLTFRYGEPDLLQIVLFLAVGMTTAKLRDDAHRLHRLATTDDLTGLNNLRSFEAQLELLVRASRKTHTPLALLALDVDRLKSLNDQYGHLSGAEAVRTVGRVIGQRLPPDAVACRYGGDEFVIAVPRCPSFLARRIADDLRRAVHDTAPVLAGRGFPAGTLSVSVGAVSALLDPEATSRDWPSREVDVGEALFRAADAALYRAKESGRDQVCVASRTTAGEERSVRPWSVG